MTSDTRPAHPVTPVTARPSRRHTRCDGQKWPTTCANESCDGCDGFRPTPSHPAETALAERYRSPAAQPVTRHTRAGEPNRSTGLMDGVGLPLAPLSAPMPPPSLYFTVTPVDARGRLADRSPIRALGWQPGQPITIAVGRQAIVITAQTGGAESITRQGHLRLPAHIRHACHLTVGDRLLVAAGPTPGVLVAYTMPLLESILLEHHTTASPSEAPR